LDSGTRFALLAIGIVFCTAFALMTLSVLIETGFDFLIAISLLIVAMIAAGLIGAIRNPPPDE